jgi:predicted DNA-binding WGR domain protein
MSVNLLDSEFLYFKEGTSDKVYHLYLTEINGAHVVIAKYGKRGGNMTVVTHQYRDRWEARTEFMKLYRQKSSKGYREMHFSDTGCNPLTDKEKMHLTLKF